MKRIALLGMLSLGVVSAQIAPPANTPGPDLASLEQIAKARSAEWETLAKDLSERVARILPCDPRSAAAINEVSKASEARLAALSDYLRTLSTKAFAETAAVKILINDEERRAVEAALERADAGQEQTSVDIQSDALAQSVKQRSSLEGPQKLLAQIAAAVRQRAAVAEQQAAAADIAVAMLRDLVPKLEARDAALREEFTAFEAERTRWSVYYLARLARTQTECAITQVGPAAPKGPARGKQ